MISGERTEQLDIFCRVTGFTSDFLSFIDVELIRFFHGALHLWKQNIINLFLRNCSFCWVFFVRICHNNLITKCSNATTRWQNIRQGTSYQQRQSEANSCYMRVQERHKQQQQPSSHTRWTKWWNVDAAADSCGIQSNQRYTRIHTVQRVSEWVGFNVPINTL